MSMCPAWLSIDAVRLWLYAEAETRVRWQPAETWSIQLGLSHRHTATYILTLLHTRTDLLIDVRISIDAACLIQYSYWITGVLLVKDRRMARAPQHEEEKLKTISFFN